jgi:uncharacterized protein DUF6894
MSELSCSIHATGRSSYEMMKSDGTCTDRSGYRGNSKGAAMGHFYFHVRTGDRLTPDEEGADFPDLAAAQREAVLAAREVLADAIMSGKPDVPEAFVIADERGRPLDIVKIATVLPRSLKT